MCLRWRGREPSAPSPVAPTGAYGRVSHGPWRPKGQLLGFGAPATPASGLTAADMGLTTASRMARDQSLGLRPTSNARNRAGCPVHARTERPPAKALAMAHCSQREFWGEHYGAFSLAAGSQADLYPSTEILINSWRDQMASSPALRKERWSTARCGPSEGFYCASPQNDSRHIRARDQNFEEGAARSDAQEHELLRRGS